MTTTDQIVLASLTVGETVVRMTQPKEANRSKFIDLSIKYPHGESEVLHFYWHYVTIRLDLPTTSLMGLLFWVLRQTQLRDPLLASAFHLASLKEGHALACRLPAKNPTEQCLLLRQFNLKSLRELSDGKQVIFGSGKKVFAVKGDERLPYYYLGANDSLESILPFETFWQGLIQFMDADEDELTLELMNKELRKKLLSEYWELPMLQVLKACLNRDLRARTVDRNLVLNDDEKELLAYLIEGIPLDVYFGLVRRID